jgi:CRISPR type III-B/RAMP module-associated protein Cmr5
VLREQERAFDSYKRVSKRKQKNQLDRKYLSQARGLIALFRSAGLLQAAEFLNTRSKPDEEDASKRLLEDLASTVLTREVSRNDFLNQVRQASFEEYMYLSRETLAVCGWYRRYAEAVAAETEATTQADATKAQPAKEAADALDG